MKILVAEDDSVSRRLLEATLIGLGYDVVSVGDGVRAWELLQTERGIQLAVLDWIMPGLDGIEVCRRMRALGGPYVYVIMLTAKDRKEDVVLGLESGADDYVTKPFDAQELRSRLRAGERIVRLESGLAQKIDDLQEALAHVKQLQGLLPICMHCKKIRDDKDTWHKLENYIQEHSQVLFTHSLCAECLARHYPEMAEKVGRRS
jgi:DNA-binding response OmpR family regulator